MISLASFHWVKLILPLETHQILRFLYHEVNPILTSNSKIIRLLSIIKILYCLIKFLFLHRLQATLIVIRLWTLYVLSNHLTDAQQK